jgi:hypothetical protein
MTAEEKYAGTAFNSASIWLRDGCEDPLAVVVNRSGSDSAGQSVARAQSEPPNRRSSVA